MSWVRIDDTTTFHPKVLAAGNEAWGAFVRLIAWSAQQLTDGKIPHKIVEMVTTKKVVSQLLAVGLLESIDDGFLIHDYHEHNLSSEEVRTLRNGRSEAGRIGGRRSGESRRSKSEASASKQNEASASSEAEASANQLASTKTNPIPSHPILRERESRDLGKTTIAELAMTLFAEFNDARCAAVKGAQRLEPTGANLKLLTERLKDGASPESIRHVIQVCAEETRKGNDPKHFNAATPFRPEQFARLVARSLKSNSKPTEQRTLSLSERIEANEREAAAKAQAASAEVGQ